MAETRLLPQRGLFPEGRVHSREYGGYAMACGGFRARFVPALVRIRARVGVTSDGAGAG